MEININTNLKPLFSMINKCSSIESHYAQMICIEDNLEEFNKKIKNILENNCSTDLKNSWENILHETIEPLTKIYQILDQANAKLLSKNSSNADEIWEKFNTQLNELDKIYSNLNELGLQILPEKQLVEWKIQMNEFKNRILTMFSSNADTCRIELQLIEKYTPDELEIISQILNDQNIKNFQLNNNQSFEEDYLLAYDELQTEFI